MLGELSPKVSCRHDAAEDAHFPTKQAARILRTLVRHPL